MGLKTNVKKDKDIVFDERLHKYFHEGRELSNVTSWISEQFVPEFNALFASINKAKKNKSEGAQITNPGLLRQYWRLQGDRAASLGTAAHIFAQMYHLNRDTRPEMGYDSAVINAYESLTKKWEIVELEKRVYSLDYMIAGTADGVIRNKETGEIGLFDWKTTSDMHKSYNKMINEMKGVPASALNKYSLQLQMYNVLGGFGASHGNLFVIQLMNDGTFKVYSSKSKDKEDVLIDYSKQLQVALERWRYGTSHALLGI